MIAWALPRKVTAVTVPISVSVDEPVLNSITVPVTCTRLPTTAAAGGAVEVNTRMPSDVAGLPSPVGSCMKKPLLSSFVTTPVVLTTWPASVLAAALPWIS